MKALLLSLLAALFLHGCSSNEHDRQMAGDSSTTSNVATDPVSYAAVHPDSAWRTYWKGHWYYFESEENLKTFEASPTTYVREDGRAQPERYKVSPNQMVR